MSQQTGAIAGHPALTRRHDIGWSEVQESFGSHHIQTVKMKSIRSDVTRGDLGAIPKDRGPTSV